MIHALVSGVMFRAPATRTSKSGKEFVIATIRLSGEGEGARFCRVMAFSDSVREELGTLTDGDALSIVGKFDAKIYEPQGGAPRVSLSIVADRVTALKKPTREKKPVAESPAAKSSPSRRSDFADDPLPF